MMYDQQSSVRDAPDAGELPDDLRSVDAYWRAANYLSVGQIYLLDNPLLREPLRLEHIKGRLLGHWGTTPGLNFAYAHLNRAIRRRDLDCVFVAGPGHGGPAVVAGAYLDGTYAERYPDVGFGADGLRRLFRQFSFPGGIPSHASPDVPGSLHEGGELGYSLAHAFGAAFDNPGLVVACVVGDGEAETGALAASWHSNKFLNPVTDGAVLPILHLNGYKIANPTVLARLPRAELTRLLEGYGYRPYYVDCAGGGAGGAAAAHRAMAAALDTCLEEIGAFQHAAREHGVAERPRWPMIVLASPKGWTGPREVDGLAVEGSWRSHQVPLKAFGEHPDRVAHLERWMRSYRPAELFDAAGRPSALVRANAPAGARRMSDNPHANGGALTRALHLPSVDDYALDVDAPMASRGEATRQLGEYLAEVVLRNPDNFRLFGPDETESNRLGAVFGATDKAWMAERLPTDEHLAPAGRVMEVLSEQLVQGWLEGYLLTGRHGLFSCYEAFVHVVDSMFNQHAKWLDAAADIPWRAPLPSLNYLLTSHVWRQDHNGFSHQDPGFIDVVVNKKASVVRVYFPPDANTLLAVTDHCLRSRHYVNVVVAGKQPSPQYLGVEEAREHCRRGLGAWAWASTGADREPDLVVGCAGDVPTREAIAAVEVLRALAPELNVRLVNVVDLMRLQHPGAHPHGLDDEAFDALFTPDRPVLFVYHGYPSLIHQLTYKRTGHAGWFVRGYEEEGTTTTPFDMCVRNGIDRYSLAAAAAERLGDDAIAPERRAAVIAYARRHHALHYSYICNWGVDLPEHR